VNQTPGVRDSDSLLLKARETEYSLQKVEHNAKREIPSNISLYKKWSIMPKGNDPPSNITYLNPLKIPEQIRGRNIEDLLNSHNAAHYMNSEEVSKIAILLQSDGIFRGSAPCKSIVAPNVT